MMLLAGSALSALDALKSLKDLVSPGSSSTASATSFGVPDTTTAATSATTTAASGSSTAMSSDTMRALLTLQSKSGSSGNLSSQLFARLDRDGNGRISKTEFDKVASSLGSTTQSNSLFDSLDSDDDGEIGGNELDAALKRQSLPATQTVQADAGTQELFQRLLQQQNEMLTTVATGKTVARAI